MTVGQLDRPKSTAPGQYLGYGLQDIRLCLYLLNSADDDYVSIEHLDDVAVHRKNGSLILEQSKSATKGNPVYDRSPELWKSFANWASLCSDANVDPNATAFRLYVTPEKSGKIVLRIHSASDQESASAVLDEIKSFRSRGKESTETSGYIDRFLDSGDECCTSIIRNFTLYTEADPIENICNVLRPTLPQAVLRQFADAAIGQAKSTADKLIRSGKPALINASNFRKKFQAFVRKHNLSNLLHPTTEPPSDLQIEDYLARSPLFVRQLLAIDCARELMVSAVSDFFRSKADKIKWAADGEVFDESFNDLDDSLIRYHTLHSDEIEDTMAGQDQKLRGRKLYRRCIGARIPLEGRELPLHFIPGAFNSLADELRVGWHPEYATLFSVERKF